MKHRIAIVSLTIPALMALVACGGTSDEEAQSENSPTNTATSVFPSTTEPTDGQLELSGGENGGEQLPSAAPSAITELTAQDRENALAAGRNIIEQYTAGGEQSEWRKALAPNITPELQNLLANFDPEPSKASVTGDAEIIEDVKVQADNPYWITVKVPTDKGEYAARLKREADRPDKWKATEILPISVFLKEQVN